MQFFSIAIIFPGQFLPLPSFIDNFLRETNLTENQFFPGQFSYDNFCTTILHLDNYFRDKSSPGQFSKDNLNKKKKIKIKKIIINSFLKKLFFRDNSSLAQLFPGTFFFRRTNFVSVVVSVLYINCSCSRSILGVGQFFTYFHVISEDLIYEYWVHLRRVASMSYETKKPIHSALLSFESLCPHGFCVWLSPFKKNLLNFSSDSSPDNFSRYNSSSGQLLLVVEKVCQGQFFSGQCFYDDS